MRHIVLNDMSQIHIHPHGTDLSSLSPYLNEMIRTKTTPEGTKLPNNCWGRDSRILFFHYIQGSMKLVATDLLIMDEDSYSSQEQTFAYIDVLSVDEIKREKESKAERKERKRQEKKGLPKEYEVAPWLFAEDSNGVVCWRKGDTVKLTEDEKDAIFDQAEVFREEHRPDIMLAIVKSEEAKIEMIHTTIPSTNNTN